MTALPDSTRAWLGEHGFTIRDPALWQEALTHGSTGRARDYQRLEFLGAHLEQRTGAGETFGKTDVDAAPALRLATDIVPAFRTAADDMAHHIAINAQPVGHVGGLVDQRLLGQALGDGRQRAGVDILARDPFRLVVLGQRLVLEHVGDADEVGRALRVKARRIRWRGGRDGLGLCRQNRDGQQQSCPAQSIKWLSHDTSLHAGQLKRAEGQASSPASLPGLFKW